MESLAKAPDEARVLIHDAARPFVDDAIIARCLAALQSHDAVAVAVPTADTIVEVANELSEQGMKVPRLRLLPRHAGAARSAGDSAASSACCSAWSSRRLRIVIW